MPSCCKLYPQHSIHRASSGFVGFARVLNSLIVELYSALGHRRPGLPEAHVCKVGLVYGVRSAGAGYAVGVDRADSVDSVDGVGSVDGMDRVDSVDRMDILWQ